MLSLQRSPWGMQATFVAAGQQHRSCARLPLSLGTKQEN